MGMACRYDAEEADVGRVRWFLPSLGDQLTACLQYSVKRDLLDTAAARDHRSELRPGGCSALDVIGQFADGQAHSCAFAPKRPPLTRPPFTGILPGTMLTRFLELLLR